MKLTKQGLRWWSLAGSLALLLVLLPARALAQGGATGSLNAPDIAGLFNIVLVLAILVFLLVEGLLIFAIVRYRRRSPDEMPEQVHGNNAMELSWTVGSGILVIILFFFTLGFYQQPRTLPEDSEPVTVEVTGHTWYWEYYYPETGVRTETTLNVPAGRPVVLDITSADVQHSFWVPEISGKVDAIPGRVQRMWFQVDEPGQFVGQCAEYCGLQHYDMLITVNVMEEQEFASWMDGEAAAVAEAAAATEEEAAALAGDPAAGEQLYNSMGCMACHSLDGSTLVGPSFQGLGARAGEVLDGVSAEDYLRESIVDPCAYLAEGFDNCVMPQNFGDRLSAQDLADLIAFLLEQ